MFTHRRAASLSSIRPFFSTVSDSDAPSMYSITRARPSGSWTMSNTRTQFGCRTAASARASRSMRCSVSLSGACASFTATVRSSCSSTASQTVPKPPEPSWRTRRNLPLPGFQTLPDFCTGAGASAFAAPGPNGSGPGVSASADGWDGCGGLGCGSTSATRVGGYCLFGGGGCCWGCCCGCVTGRIGRFIGAGWYFGTFAG